MRKGANLETIKDGNCKLVLSCLQNQQVSRAEIADITGLARSTVTAITKDLIAKGQICEVGTESTAIGRSPILLDIVKDYRYVMGILLHRREIAVCIVNLKMECLEAISLPISQVESPQQAIQWAFDQGKSIFSKHKIAWEKCAAIGINSPGPLNSKTGEIFNPPDFNLFHYFNPVKYLSSLCNIPIHVSNASILMAVYETQQNKSLTDFLFVVIDRGVGSAIVQNGQIFHGGNGFAGEFGHMSVDINGKLCTCGNRGCLEGYITRKAIEEQFHLDSYPEMIDRAYEGDSSAMDVLDHIARLFAMAITNAVNLLDMDVVVIAGELNYRHELLFSRIQARVNQSIIRPKDFPLKVVPSDITKDGNISYITSVALQKYFNP